MLRAGWRGIGMGRSKPPLDKNTRRILGLTGVVSYDLVKLVQTGYIRTSTYMIYKLGVSALSIEASIATA